DRASVVAPTRASRQRLWLAGNGKKLHGFSRRRVSLIRRMSEAIRFGRHDPLDMPRGCRHTRGTIVRKKAVPDRLPLRATKLGLPPTRSNLVARPRLIAQLDRGLSRALTLISAPAGFGKTVLLAEWLTKLKIANEELRKGIGSDTLLNSQ